MVDGHIHLARKILEGNLRPRGRFSKFEAWIYLLLKANGMTKKWRGIVIERGSFVTSQRQLAGEFRWGIASVNRFLSALKAERRVELKRTDTLTHIKICKYNQFNPLAERQMEQKWNKNGTKVETTKNDNKEKESNKEIIHRQANACPEANEIVEFYKNTYGFKKTIPKQLENWRAAKWLFEQYGVEKSCQAILAAKSAFEDSVSGAEKVPLVKNLMDLKEKYDQLRAYYGRKVARQGRVADLSEV